MKNSTNNTTETRKSLIASLIENGKIVADAPIVVNDKVFLKSATNGRIYLHNREANKAFQYEADGTGCKPITLSQFNVQVEAYKQRKAAAEAKAEREKIAKWKAEHGEAKAQDGRSKETNTVVPDVDPTQDEIQLVTENQWVGTKQKAYLWEPGSIITVRAMKQPDLKEGEDEKPTIWLDEDGYHIKFEEVRPVNGVAVPTGKEVTYTFAATQEAVDSFKNAVNKRSDNWFWNQLNAGVENRWKCRKVTTIGLQTFFAYLRKYPIKVLFDFTEWVDGNGESHRSKYPKVRLWLPNDFTEKKQSRQWMAVKATF